MNVKYKISIAESKASSDKFTVTYTPDNSKLKKVIKEVNIPPTDDPEEIEDHIRANAPITEWLSILNTTVTKKLKKDFIGKVIDVEIDGHGAEIKPE